MIRLNTLYTFYLVTFLPFTMYIPFVGCMTR